MALTLHSGELAEFDVFFQPTLMQRVEEMIHLSIVDNQYEETSIHLVGEGFHDDITLDNVRSLVEDGDRVHLGDDVVEGERKWGEAPWVGVILPTSFQRLC